MRSRAILPAVAALFLLAAPAAHAQVGASGTRLSVAGSLPRFCMTYGHAEDPELYAPILPELRRLGIVFQRQGDDYAVYYRSVKVDQWPIVTARELIPESGDHPAVLVMGGNIFVPVRHLARRFGLNVAWDARANIVSLSPSGRPVRARVAEQPESAETGPATLTGLSVEPENGALRLRVRASAPVRPRWLTVRSPLPYRIALDFPNARWAPDVRVPEPAGDVRAIRIGHPEPETARLVLEVPSLEIRVTRVEVQAGEIVASIGRGPEARIVETAPGVAAQIQAIVRRRNPLVARSDRSDPLDLGPITVLPPDEPSVERPNLPSRIRAAGSLVGRTIVVDAGHGGHDTGAPGRFSKEKDLCLAICHLFRRALEARGARVIMTREEDRYVSLQERVNIANSSGADLFISIHLNAMPRPNLQSGSETYYHTPQSQKLARFLHARLVGTVRGRDGGIRNRRFYVVRNTTMPSVLLEVGYINHERDEELLRDPEFQAQLAENLALGVLEYYGTDLTRGN